MAEPQYALSLKQPWAGLLAAGRKVIEVRRWPTARRGPILIHAARVSDPRPEVWKRVPAELDEICRLVGGIIGTGDLLNCQPYRSREAFAADCDKHWNEPDWFTEPALYGFLFANLRPLPFRRFPGWMRFFPVDEKRLPRANTPLF